MAPSKHRFVLAAFVLASIFFVTGCGTEHRPVDVQRIAADGVTGPECIAIGVNGTLVTGTTDGRIVRLIESGEAMMLGETAGRPLGVAVAASGKIYVADARRGLLELDVDQPGSEPRVLLERGGPLKLTFPNSIAVAAGGLVYFTDTSRRYDFDQMAQAALVRDATGRLIELNPRDGTTRVLLDDLVFANGVALTPDESVAYIAETFGYRVRRYVLGGPRAGESDVLIDDLPGLPDNLHVDEMGRLWVALYSRRMGALELIQRLPPLAWILSPLAGLIDSKPPRVGRVAVVSAAGELLKVYELGSGVDAYAPVTSAVPRGEWLYLGSTEQRGVGRIRLDAE